MFSKYKFKKKFFLFSLIIFLFFFFIYFFLPNSCKKFSYNCNSDLKKIFFQTIKKNKHIYEFSKAFYWKYFNLKISPGYVRIKEFKEENNLEYKKNIFLKGILENNIYSKEIQNFPKNETNKWIRSHGGNYNLKFNKSSQINLENLSNLKLKWKHQSISSSTINEKWINTVQVNPIFFDNKLISAFPNNTVKAFDPINGNVFWEFKDKELKSPGRGILGYISPEGKKFIFLTFGSNIYKINSKDGTIDINFGENGKINSFTKAAPATYKNQLIITNLKSVSLYDIKTGELKSKVSLFRKEFSKFEGNVWGGSALDANKGILYVTTGNPKPATYGAYRVNKDLLSNSVIAVDLNQKKIKWNFQEIFHDLWDYDISSPPIIHDLKIKNDVHEIVIANTKSGNTLILERNTGKPLFDIHYRKSPKSYLPGESAAQMQLEIKLPEKFSKIDFSKNDFAQLDKNKKKEINKKLFNSKYGWFETPSLTKDLIIFGLHGGAQWHGSALDPFKQFLYIPVNNVPWKIRPFAQDISIINKLVPKEIKLGKEIYITKCSSCHGLKRNGSRLKKGEKLVQHMPSLVGLTLEDQITNSKFLTENLMENKHIDSNIKQKDLDEIYNYFKWKDKYLYKDQNLVISSNYASWSQFLTKDGLPASNPPWGYIAKLDLNTGKIKFKSPIGTKKINGKEKVVGTTIFGGISINNSDLIFANGTADNFAYILDSITGEIKWRYRMEAAGSAPPIIYEYKGKEYVTFVATGGRYYDYSDKGSTIYTFALQ